MVGPGTIGGPEEGDRARRKPENHGDDERGGRSGHPLRSEEEEEEDSDSESEEISMIKFAIAIWKRYEMKINRKIQRKIQDA